LLDRPDIFQKFAVFNRRPVCYNIPHMSNLTSLTSAQFKRAAEITDQIEALNTELAELLGQTEPALVQPSVPVSQPVKTRKKYKLSAAGKAKKVAALKARWAKVKGAESETKPAGKRRKMSAEGRARIAAAAKARWARARAEKA
jgi:hypothetical protein